MGKGERCVLQNYNRCYSSSKLQIENVFYRIYFKRSF